MQKNKKFTLGTLFQVIFSVVAVTIFGFSGILLYKGYKNPNKVPDILGYKPMVVLSGSMTPEFCVGDIVFVKETNEIETKDIIAYKIENTVVTHRVVQKIAEGNETFYKTKGDANISEDVGLVDSAAVEGKYMFKIGKVGKIILLLKTRVGMTIFVVLFIVFLYLCRTKRIKNRFIFQSWEGSR